MKLFFLRQVWPLIAGLLTAFVVMLIAEYVNSFFYPLPEGLDFADYTAVATFTDSLPWTAYILVLLGWMLGAFKAGIVTTYLSRETTFRLSLLSGALLTILGLANNLMLGQGMHFMTLMLPVFILFAYLGHRYLLYVYRNRTIVEPD